MLRFFRAAAVRERACARKRNEFARLAPPGMDYRATLRADCARCQALCCVSLSFDRGEWFAFDKPANATCRHLGPGLACAIHGELETKGQAGCAAYDCYGAGQVITQQVFAGVSWKRATDGGAAMFDAFRRLKRVHELRLLLHEAGRLALPVSRATARRQLLTRLEPPLGFSRESLAAIPLSTLEAAVHAWLRSLAGELAPPPTRRTLPLVPR